MPAPYVHVDRVRYADLDVTHRLAHLKYMEYFESARIAFMRDMWPGRSTADADRGPLGVIFGRCRIHYRGSAFYGEEVATTCTVGEVGRSSFRIDFVMRVGERLIAEGSGWLVAFDYEAQAAVPLPDDRRAALEA